MPILSVLVPQIPANAKDEFLANWPKVAAGIKAQPTVSGVSGGPIIVKDGAPVSDFEFLHCVIFPSLEDHAAFVKSDLVQNMMKEHQSKAVTPPKPALYQLSDLPANGKPKEYTQFSRLELTDESKSPEIKAAWDELVKELGKESFGGPSIGEGSKSGVGLIGWDSIEEAKEAGTKPNVAAAVKKWESLGTVHTALVKMEYY